jgi:transmembrane sensor
MNVQRQIDRLIAYQAAEWYEAMKDTGSSGNADFIRWIAESPRHMEAFLAVSSEAPVVRKVLAGGEFDLGSLLKEVSGGENVLTLCAPEASRPLTPPRGASRRRWKLWSAAAAVATLAIAISLQRHFSDWQRFETPVGEQRTIQLVEGSIVNLNTESLLDVKFTESQRELRLSHGEATFKVAHDASRPFRVRTPGAIVEAIGTQFNVYARADGVTTVSVLEGKVQVSDAGVGIPHLGGTSAKPVFVTAGEELRVASPGHHELYANSNVGDAIAWQQRKLVFKRTALEDIAEEFNRYNRSVQIRLEGIDAGTFRFSGAFNADDPQSLATLLVREPDLTVEDRGTEIVIRRR